MPVSLKNIFSAERLRYTGACLWQEVSGIAKDYWKDGNWEKPKNHDLDDLSDTPPTSASPFISQKPTGPAWHAQPGEISEKLWGQGYVTPCDEDVTNRLIQPLGLTKDMSLLDLSAGLGGRLMRTTEATGVYITGLEPDPEIAARGMAMSVAAGRGKKVVIATYDPSNLILDRKYDCIISRETIYRVPDKVTFINSIVAACKPKAQVSFTDYIVNPESRNDPVINAWCGFEKGATPVGLVEMAEIWAKAGIELRVHEDLTDYYREEVKKGLARFADFMASGIQPDMVTKAAIKKRISTWAFRMSAMHNGMKFYRFYGSR